MKTKIWIISSNKMNKTVVVTIDSYKIHRKYSKRYKVTKKFYAHVDDSSMYNIWDKVTIIETIPLSKLKKWKVVSEK